MSLVKRLYSGRIGSLSYFLGTLLSWGCFWLMGELPKTIPSSTIVFAIEMAIILALFVFMFSVFVRRLHDLDKSGWLSLLTLVPLVNVIMGIILLFKPGSNEANRFGAPPQGGKFAFKELFAL